MHKRPAPPSHRLLLATGLALVAACEGTCFTPPPESVLTVDFVRPTDRQVLSFADDADPGTPGFQYAVEVLAADSQGRMLTLESAALETRLSTETAFAAAGAAALSGAGATFPGIVLRQGTNVIRASVIESGSRRQASKQITVEVQIGRPQVQALTFQGDADGDGSLNQSEQATGDPVVVVSVLGVEDGQPVVIKDQATQMTTYGTGTVSGGSAAVALTGLMATDTTEASFDLVAEVTDRAGRTNKISSPTPSEPLNTAAFKTLGIDRVVPELTVLAPTGPTTPIQLHMVDDADPATAGFQVRVTVRTSADVGTNGVTVVRTPSGGSTGLTPDPVTHEATLDFTVPEQGPFDYTFDVTAADPAKNARTGQVSVRIGAGGAAGFFSAVQFVDETLNAEPAGPFKFNVRRTVPVGGSQAIVALPNERYWMAANQAALPTTHIVDQDLAAAGAQVVVQGAIASGSSCTPKLLYGGVEKAAGPALATHSPTVVRLAATLDTNTSGPFQLAADCGGGRLIAAAGAALTVDIEPPAAVNPTLVLVTTGSFSRRRPGIDVTWSAGTDDGANGTASGFEVRWGTDATLELNPPGGGYQYDAQVGIDTNSRFFDDNRTQRVGTGFGAAARTARIGPLPAVGAYYVSVRAKDDVGNLGGPLAAADCATGAGCLRDALSSATVSNPGTTGTFGFFITSSGDLNGDQADDLAIVSGGAQRALWLAYSDRTNADLSGFTNVAGNQVVPPASTLGATSVFDVSIGNVASAAGEASALQDLVVADPAFNGLRGRYLLYPGRAGTVNPAPVELRGSGGTSSTSGAPGPSGSGSELGYARVVADFGRPGGGGPDGLDELLISANNEASGAGRVYLFYGRPYDPGGGAGSWQALATSTDPGDTANPYIPMSSADRVFTGTTTTVADRLGVRRGYASLGDITGDSVPDFAIPASNINTLFLHSGGTVNSGNTGLPLQLLQPEPPPYTPTPTPTWAWNGWRDGFGAMAVGNLALGGSAPARDLAVGFPFRNAVRVYMDGTANGFGNAPLVIVGNAAKFGNTLGAGDLDGDGTTDLLIGTNACVTLCTDGRPGGAWIFFNKGTAGSEFDLTTNTSFSVSRLMRDPNDLNPSASNALGITVAVGDFNGDGVKDVAYGDNLATAGTGRVGKVFVRY